MYAVMVQNIAKEIDQRVSSIVSILIKAAQDPREEKHFEKKYLQPECKKLEHFVQHTIPSWGTNDIVNPLFLSVIHMYKNLESSYAKNQRKVRKWTGRQNKRFLDVSDMYPGIKKHNAICKKRLHVCRQIALNIGCAVLHPSLTQLHFINVGIAKNPTFLAFLNMFLNKLLSNITYLTKLSLDKQVSRKIVLKHLPKFKNLDSFTYSNADNACLKILKDTSLFSLRHLNVSGSKRITADSNFYILNMGQLVHLSIDGTSISGEEMMCYLRNHWGSSYSITTLKANFSLSQIELVPRIYPHLKFLEVHVTNPDEHFLLGSLKLLEKLHMYV